MKIGKYSVLDVLGKGGMGIVYRAKDPDLNRDVAIKAIHFESVSENAEREELIRRFLREGQAAARLTHPNIVNVFDVGREGDLTYLVMQHVEGQSLERQLGAGKRFTAGETLRLLIPLCRAVDYAHQHGVIHRDLKPGNILLDNTGKPFLADFGVAKVASSTLTVSGTAFGTPGYIAPEQLRGGAADQRSDVFSMGVLLFVLLTGQEPFAGSKLEEVWQKIVHQEPPPPSSLNPELSPGFDAVVARALAKAPESRYQSCAEMAAALESLDKAGASTLTVRVKDEETEGERPNPARWKVAVVVSSLVVLILAVSAVAVFVFKIFRTHPQLQVKQADPLLVAQSTRTGPPTSTEQALPVDPTQEKLSRLKEMYAASDLSGTIILAREILAEDPGQPEAQSLLGQAEKRIEEAETARVLDEAVLAYENQDFGRSLSGLNRVLEREPESERARHYRGLVAAALSKAEVLRLLERQRRAEEEKDLLVLVDDMGSSDLAAQRKDDALLLFNFYDNLRSLMSDIVVEIREAGRAEAQFSHLVTGVYKKTGEKKVLVQKVEKWRLEKNGPSWKVVSLEGDS